MMVIYALYRIEAIVNRMATTPDLSHLEEELKKTGFICKTPLKKTSNWRRIIFAN